MKELWKWVKATGVVIGFITLLFASVMFMYQHDLLQYIILGLTAIAVVVMVIFIICRVKEELFP